MNVSENSDLYIFMTHLFEIMCKYNAKKKDKYDVVYNFLLIGTNFTKSKHEILMKFFKRVSKHLNTEDQIKQLFRTFRSKIQRESFMPNLQNRIKELNDLRTMVYVRTEVETNSYDKNYAEERNRTFIIHQKEIQVFKNEIQKLHDTNKLLIKINDDKDKLINEIKDDKIKYEKRIDKLEDDKIRMEQKYDNDMLKMELKLKAEREFWEHMYSK